jgi:hypothetical protein
MVAKAVPVAFLFGLFRSTIERRCGLNIDLGARQTSASGCWRAR